MVIASCSKDTSIKFFDMTRLTAKRAFRYINDACNIHSICFHPSGDYILAGTDNETIRLYDVNTLQCFSAKNPLDHHSNVVKQVRYSSTGRIYVSCSKDGSVKLWDGVSSRCTTTLSNAHGGLEVTSVRLTRNERYLLTSGKDSIPKLWDLTMSRFIFSFFKISQIMLSFFSNRSNCMYL
jgi:cleavage stimulation factor subunit 1